MWLFLIGAFLLVCITVAFLSFLGAGFEDDLPPRSGDRSEVEG